ncbi:MAG TPA: hypothetical protein VK211_28490 [Kamptonema sp.]|nr:hypothetical protein [Kamptonema sp.]
MSRRNNEVLGIILGIVLILAIHSLAMVGLIFAANFIPYLNQGYNVFFIPASIGLWQMIYVIPLVFLLKKRQRWGVMKGVIACAVLTALLNGGCWIYLKQLRI